jgi:hypothetical protein
MTSYRIFPVVILLVAAPFAAIAQFDGMPGLFGAVPMGFGNPAGAPIPACQQLVALRDETQKHWEIIQEASERNAPAPEACRLFRSFLAAEAKFNRGVEDHGRTCGAPHDVMTHVNKRHAKALRIGRQVCQEAQRPRVLGPSLWDDMPRWEFWKRSTGDFSWREELIDKEDDCNLCGKTGDFGPPPPTISGFEY